MSSAMNHVTLLKYALCACWVATGIIGYHGFFKNHDLLTVPLTAMQLPSGFVFTGAMLMFCTAVIAPFVRSNSSALLFTLAVCSYVLLCVGDMHRLTPYMIVFFNLFALFIFFKNDQALFYGGLVFALSGLYIFSGIHKMNTGFVTQVAPLFYMHSSPLPYNPIIGYTMAGLEMLLGFLLIVKPSRKAAGSALIIMHLIIMFKLSPWRYGFNYIVLPWNVLMICSLLYLLIKSPVSPGHFKIKHACFASIFLFFWALPAASLFTHIPENLSFKLYSGKSLPGYLSFSNKIDDYKSLDLHPDGDFMLLSLQQVSMQERGIAFNAALSNYKKVVARFRKRYPSTHKLHIEKLETILKGLPK